MNGFSSFGDWFDNNWVDLARLLVQLVILGAVVLYSRKILASMRASQEQLGALLRLSVSGGTAHEQRPAMEEPEVTPPGFAAPSFTPPSFTMKEEPAPMAASPAPGFTAHSPAFAPEQEQTLGGRAVADRIADRIAVKEPEPVTSASVLTPWVAAPVQADAERAESFAARMSDSTRNLGRWLENPPRQSRGNPLSRIVRWLQAPAGSKAPVRG